MAIRLADLTANERSCVVTFDGETAEVHYRPSAYTPRLEGDFARVLQNGTPGNAIASLLAGVLLSWDVLGADGQALDVTVETMVEMPTRFLSTVMEQITEDMSTEREARKNLEGGSPQAANKANHRTGTR
jgi:hypothetical protein